MKFREWKRRGQVMVLWAFLTPLLICFVGLGMDLGWYYLNVSRLQNAADAAALAGAMNLVEQNKNKDLNDYYVSSLTSPPTDLKKYERVSLVNNSGVSYIKTIDPAQIAEGKAEAQSYANKNLSDTSASGTVSDNWNTSSDTDDHVVKFSSSLYAKVIDTQREDVGTPSNGLKYYEVILTEQVNHLFLRGFDPMEAKVVAYALLKPHDKDLVTAISILEKTKTIQNWEYQNIYKNFNGNWSHFQDTTIEYVMGDTYRNETVNVKQDGGSRVTTSANNYANYKWNEVDVLNLDVKQDVTFSKEFSTDWDLGAAAPEGTRITDTSWSRWMANKTGELRIHNSMNFDYAWEDRNHADLKPDILWTRIESDPIWSHIEGKRDSNGKLSEFQSTLNSVRQFILNVHTSNTALTTDEKSYKYRPFFVFYMGPETYDANNTVRQSQPVILNLYADWNAIIYMPNSPVIINGNKHKLTGFVIAKEFLRLAVDSDYTSNGYITTHDEYGHIIFVKQSDTISENQFNELKKSYTPKTDAKGNIGLYKEPEIRKYPILSITKEESEQYSDFTAYVAATYKSKFMAATGLTESEISTVTFPQEENNGEEAYTVATTALSDTKVNDNYVKVFVGTTEKYIDKINLPYVKIRRNSKRPYVSVYDLKKKKLGAYNNNTYAGVTITDDSITATSDNTSADLWNKDDRSVNKNLLENTYDKFYVSSQLTIEDGHFTLNWEVSEEMEPVATYRKVYRTGADGEKEYLYIKEDATFYLKTVPSGATGKNADNQTVENPVITDQNGNVQTRALPAGSTRETNGNEQPGDTGVGKRLKISGSSDQEYRVPGLEVVYYKSVFNLSEDSCYSYFQIADLVRVNYTYMNVNEVEKKPDGRWKVDDMFFPTRRAKWID